MVLGGGIFISKGTALRLIEILELAQQLCEELGGPDYLGQTSRLEVRLHRALASAAVSGLSAEAVRSCLKEG